MSTPNSLNYKPVDRYLLGRTFDELYVPGTCVEVRILFAHFAKSGLIEACSYRNTVAGWFNDRDAFVLWMTRIRNASVYVCLNPVQIDLLSRVCNRLDNVKSTTTDEYVVLRRWMFIDIDPKRAPDISSTEMELELAVTTAKAILKDYGETIGEACVWGISGNGTFIWVRIDSPNDKETESLILRSLHALSAKYSTEAVKIDVKTSNASRIAALPGTWKCKGENTQQRPWRMARFENSLDQIKVLDLSAWAERYAPVIPDYGRPLSAPPSSIAATAAAGLKPPTSQAASTHGLVEPGTEEMTLEYKIKRARAFMDSTPPAVEKQDGDNRTFKMACAIGPGFDLPFNEAFKILLEWNVRCDPVWREDRLSRKLDQAYMKERRRGWLLKQKSDYGGSAGSGSPNATSNAGASAGGEADQPPTNPHRLARIFLNGYEHDDHVRLAYWQDSFYRWRLEDPHWSRWSDSEVRSAVTRAVEQEFNRVYQEELATALDGEAKLHPVSTGIVSSVIQAATSLAMLEVADVAGYPAWLSSDHPWKDDANDLLPCRNTLLNLKTGESAQPTPAFFASHCAACDYDPAAQPPDIWLEILRNQWPDDPDSISALQEWFGYCLTADTSQQTALLLIGPPRSGKGTISRALKALVGQANTASPTMGQLAEPFGKQSLIGKTLAIIADARISARHDMDRIVEDFLSITGEDSRSVAQKHKESWEGTLKVRFVVMSNELPKLTDESAAIVSRFLFLKTRQSFIGKEDRTLDRRIAAALPGILNWAIAGRKRLAEQGRFTRPANSQAMAEEMRDVASPVGLFVRDCCELGSDRSVETKRLYEKWKEWAKEQGLPDYKIGSIQTFGCNLKAAYPEVSTSNPLRVGGQRLRFFQGVELNNTSVF